MSSISPLTGVRVLEMEGLAPGPYCGMILSDFGANVVSFIACNRVFLYICFLIEPML